MAKKRRRSNTREINDAREESTTAEILVTGGTQKTAALLSIDDGSGLSRKKQRKAQKTDIAAPLESEIETDRSHEEMEIRVKKRKRSKKKEKSEGTHSLQPETKPNPVNADFEKINSEDVPSPSLVFPYPTDDDDHCESPKDAYEHVRPLLETFKQKSLLIYDPYYCDGAVRKNLEQLGFPNVYNKKEDCYQVWQSNSALPPFHVLVTNPPYSGDHMEKLIRFVTSSLFGNRPWFLLLPNWVHKKDFFLDATRHIRPFYIVPRKRYVYLPPAGFRQAKKSDVHKKSSPFVSMWYVWGGTDERNQELIQAFYKSNKVGCDLARSKSALRDLRRKQR